MEDSQKLLQEGLVFRRRSYRTYTSEPVAPAQMDLLLRAACCAPSSKALYPCSFLVVDSREELARIREYHQMAKAIDTAPAAIIVCADITRSWNAWRDDAAAATMNLLLAAEEIGLGACWHGVYPRVERVNRMKAQFSLPDAMIPYSMVSVGHPLARKEPNGRFQPEAIHYNRW